jgi:uncharacterized membrane protein
MVKVITPKADQQSGKIKTEIKTKTMTKKKAISKTIAKPKVRTKKVVAKKNTLKNKRAVATKRVAAVKKRKVVKKSVPRKRTASKKRKVAKNKIAVPEKIGGMRTAAFGYLVSGIFELVMAIPFLGWLIGVGSFGVMWIAGIVINIVVIVALINRKKPIYANIVAILGNVLGVVPVLGWLLHLIATVLLFVLFFKEEKKNC